MAVNRIESSLITAVALDVISNDCSTIEGLSGNNWDLDNEIVFLSAIEVVDMRYDPPAAEDIMVDLYLKDTSSSWETEAFNNIKCGSGDMVRKEFFPPIGCPYSDLRIHLMGYRTGSGASDFTALTEDENIFIHIEYNKKI